MTEMQKNGFEICHGLFIKKDSNPRIKTRSGYAIRCYFIYPTREDMRKGTNVLGCEYHIKDAREMCKDYVNM